MNQQPVYGGRQNLEREAAHLERQKAQSDHRNQVYRIYLELCEHGGWDTLSAESQQWFKQQLTVL
jgi:hypothetical protein